MVPTPRADRGRPGSSGVAGGDKPRRRKPASASERPQTSSGGAGEGSQGRPRWTSPPKDGTRNQDVVRACQPGSSVGPRAALYQGKACAAHRTRSSLRKDPGVVGSCQIGSWATEGIARRQPNVVQGGGPGRVRGAGCAGEARGPDQPREGTHKGQRLTFTPEGTVKKTDLVSRWVSGVESTLTRAARMLRGGAPRARQARAGAGHQVSRCSLPASPWPHSGQGAVGVQAAMALCRKAGIGTSLSVSASVARRAGEARQRSAGRNVPRHVSQVAAPTPEREGAK